MDIDSTGGVNEAPFHVTEEGLAEVAKLLEGKVRNCRDFRHTVFSNLGPAFTKLVMVNSLHAG